MPNHPFTICCRFCSGFWRFVFERDFNVVTRAHVTFVRCLVTLGSCRESCLLFTRSFDFAEWLSGTHMFWPISFQYAFFCWKKALWWKNTCHEKMLKKVNRIDVKECEPSTITCTNIFMSSVYLISFQFAFGNEKALLWKSVCDEKRKKKKENRKI
jgi:hypothetical protein